MPIETRVRAADGTVSGTVAELGAEVAAVPVPSGPDGPVAVPAEIARLLPFGLDELLTLHRAKGEPGEITAAHVPVDGRVVELLLYGVGKARPADLRKAGAALARRGRGRSAIVAGVPERRPRGVRRRAPCSRPTGSPRAPPAAPAPSASSSC
ncbi:hypothetical protein [Actinomadura sp. CNU-125]|uniref:hypothetical protein n=1 Tax=Actinomadura sp. CNU-125 TaxID=1904961 RepID=UPI003967261D